MIIFLDTSALVKLFQAETGSENVLRWVKSANITHLLDLARLEFRCALHRRYRNQELTLDEMALLNAGFEERWASFHIFPLNSRVVDEAEQLMKAYGKHIGLRSLDALHAGAFSLVAEKNWHFVAADKNLNTVISDLGFKVLNPLED